MAIVLPRQILSGHDPAVVEIRKWMLTRMRILAVVDLPPETFRPYTGTITSLLFAERDSSPPDDYDIYMAAARYVGHDRRGNPLIQRREDGTPVYDSNFDPQLLDDLPSISSLYETFRRASLEQQTDPSAFQVSSRDVLRQSLRRLDASYYDPTKNDVYKAVRALDGAGGGTIAVKSIGDLVRLPGDVFYPGRHKRNYCPPGPEAVPFLSGTNILQGRGFDVKWQPRAYKPVQGHLVEEGWILVTRSGSTGRVLLVGKNLAGFEVDRGVAVSEHVIRIVVDENLVDPGYLYAYLSSESVGRVLLSQGIYASVVQHITPQHVKDIPVPLPPPAAQKRIGDRVRAAEAASMAAGTELSAIRSAIEDGLGSGDLAWLESV